MTPSELHTKAPLVVTRTSRTRLLKLRQRELKYIKIAIKVDISGFYDGETAITTIEEGIKQYTTDVNVYNANLASIIQKSFRITHTSKSRETGAKSDATAEPGYLDIPHYADVLVASRSLNELIQLNKQQRELEDCISHLESVISTLKRELHDWQVELAFKKRSLLLHLVSRKATETSLEPTVIHGYSGPSRRDLERIPNNLFGHKYHMHFYGDTVFKLAIDRIAIIPFKGPVRVTVETFIPTPSGTLREITYQFTRLHTLVLVNIWPKGPTSLADSLKNLEYLKPSYNESTPFSLESFLVQGFEECHIQHTNRAALGRLRRVSALPRLHTLEITPHEGVIFLWLSLPVLRTLILHASASATSLKPVHQIVNSRHILCPLTNITFEGWRLANNPAPVRSGRMEPPRRAPYLRFDH